MIPPPAAPGWAARPLVRRARILQSGLTSCALTALVGAAALGVLGASPTPDETREGLDPSSSQVDRLFLENRCSVTGFADHVVPSKAMVRRSTGRIALVSYAEGWQVLTGDRPGRLVAVCLGPARPAT
ncbi:hypothetical protein [Nocardioides sp. YIM 152588]|uniref:hypothetical protein n=1 Tax=Nocardioides sp. YIM 152588 TaxID=3158259 RepID=UPI0032E4E9A5